MKPQGQFRITSAKHGDQTLTGKRRTVAGKNVCVLISGGVDSCVLLCLMAGRFQQVYPLYVRCGLRWEDAELYWLRKFLAAVSNKKAGSFRGPGIIHPLTVLSLPVFDVYGSHWSLPGTSRGKAEIGKRRLKKVPGRQSPDQDVYLPGRNLLLLAKAGVFCSRHQIQDIAMGQLRGNPFPDATPQFLRYAEKAISSSMKIKIRIHAPFLRKSKTEVVRLAKRLKAPLNLAFSCLSPTETHGPCGQCNKCAEREKVLAMING